MTEWKNMLNPTEIAKKQCCIPCTSKRGKQPNEVKAIMMSTDKVSALSLAVSVVV